MKNNTINKLIACLGAPLGILLALHPLMNLPFLNFVGLYFGIVSLIGLFSLDEYK